MCPVNMRLTTVSVSVPNEDITLGQASLFIMINSRMSQRDLSPMYHLVVSWMCSDSSIQAIVLWQTSSIDCYIMEHCTVGHKCIVLYPREVDMRSSGTILINIAIAHLNISSVEAQIQSKTRPWHHRRRKFKCGPFCITQFVVRRSIRYLC